MIEFTLYNSENVSNIYDNGGGRLTPIKIDGWWNLKNREGGLIKVRVIKKAGSYNVVEILNKNRKFLVEISKGALISFEIIGQKFFDCFLFSPDVENNGNPIDCEEGVFCYYPSSSIQITAFLDEGSLLVMVPNKEKETGWCIFPKNDPDFMRYIGERGKCSAYKLPTGEKIWVWTKYNCPEVTLTEIVR